MEGHELRGKRTLKYSRNSSNDGIHKFYLNIISTLSQQLIKCQKSVKEIDTTVANIIKESRNDAAINRGLSSHFLSFLTTTKGEVRAIYYYKLPSTSL